MEMLIMRIFIVGNDALFRLALATRLSVIFNENKLFQLKSFFQLSSRRVKVQGDDLVILDLGDFVTENYLYLIDFNKKHFDVKTIFLVNKNIGQKLTSFFYDHGILVLHKSLSARFIYSEIYFFVTKRKLESADICHVKLTARQLAIVKLMAIGLSNFEISEKLGICENTVKVHVYRLFKKMNVSSRVQLLAVLRANELIN